MEKREHIRIFQRYGVELEYMIVDKDTLSVKPIADEVLKKVLGHYGNDVKRGLITWSNELVLHVLELKCDPPAADFVALNKHFQENIAEVNNLLASFGAKLMPTAAHPWMNPYEETRLWPHDNGDVYAAYNRIFNCSGHGWANLQSTHINLPFQGDEEFARLHAAIRLLLPILPALAASSPILDKQLTGYTDKRLDYYQSNQRNVPCLTGKVIPEQVFSKEDYYQKIYDTIRREIAPHDPDNILEPVWLNSRGAIARFDRGAIEIRVLDIQECPAADLAILSLIISTLKMLVEEKNVSLKKQQACEIPPLFDIFSHVIRNGEQTVINNATYLQCFGLQGKEICTAGDLWQHIWEQALGAYPDTLKPWKTPMEIILQKGPLSRRIVQALQGDYSQQALKSVYGRLCDCLQQNIMFMP